MSTGHAGNRPPCGHEFSCEESVENCATGRRCQVSAASNIDHNGIAGTRSRSPSLGWKGGRNWVLPGPISVGKALASGAGPQYIRCLSFLEIVREENMLASTRPLSRGIVRAFGVLLAGAVLASCG